MYESPITKIYGDIQSQIIKQDEENMMFAVNQTVGYDVDKQELIKALNYDRNQYHIGFEDARKMYERPKGEWLLIGHDDTCNFYRCSFCGYEEHDNFTKHNNFCPDCGADMRGE